MRLRLVTPDSARAAIRSASRARPPMSEVASMKSNGTAAALWQQADKKCPLHTFSGQPGGAACVLPITLWSSVRSAATGAWSAPEELPNAPHAEAQDPARAKIAAPPVGPLGDQDPQIAVDSAGVALGSSITVDEMKRALKGVRDADWIESLRRSFHQSHDNILRLAQREGVELSIPSVLPEATAAV